MSVHAFILRCLSNAYSLPALRPCEMRNAVCDIRALCSTFTHPSAHVSTLTKPTHTGSVGSSPVVGIMYL